MRVRRDANVKRRWKEEMEERRGVAGVMGMVDVSDTARDGSVDEDVADTSGGVAMMLVRVDDVVAVVAGMSAVCHGLLVCDDSDAVSWYGMACVTLGTSVTLAERCCL